MRTQKIFFTNRSNIELSAYLDSPDSVQVTAYAVFAHCFTCSKNIKSYSHISRALTKQGIAVLRPDFTGIGESKGIFSETNFQTNINDLLDAANYLELNHQAPQLLIGHSLGGLATLAASQSIPSSRAVALIGTPDETIHLYQLLSGDKLSKKNPHKREIVLGGKTFEISDSLLNSLNNCNTRPIVESLNQPLLILHSPLDDTVSLGSAERNFASAKQPKNFICLENADHLLSNEKHARYAGEVIATWATPYMQKPQ